MVPTTVVRRSLPRAYSSAYLLTPSQQNRSWPCWRDHAIGGMPGKGTLLPTFSTYVRLRVLQYTYQLSLSQGVNLPTASSSYVSLSKRCWCFCSEWDHRIARLGEDSIRPPTSFRANVFSSGEDAVAERCCL